jgi:DNA-binding transcriptional LysR family regulator
MDLKRARYFLAVAETLSFTAAAKRLHMSQPPLSQQIAALENELGVKLFERHSRKVALTESGQALRRHAEAMLAQAARAAMEVRAIGKGHAGILHVGATSSVLFSGLSERIAEFLRGNAEVAIVLQEMAPRDQLLALRAGRLDLSFMRFAPQEKELVAERAWPERVGVIVPPRHPLAARKSVRIAALRHEKFVFYRMNDSAFAAQLHAACVAQGFAPHIVQEVIESFSLHSLVAAGLGIGFVPERLGQLPGTKFIPLQGPAPRADVHVLMAPRPSPLSARFAAYCRQQK